MITMQFLYNMCWGLEGWAGAEGTAVLGCHSAPYSRNLLLRVPFPSPSPPGFRDF